MSRTTGVLINLLTPFVQNVTCITECDAQVSVRAASYSDGPGSSIGSEAEYYDWSRPRRCKCMPLFVRERLLNWK
jgi:hypothetical protein